MDGHIIFITGGAWITAAGCGTLRGGERPVLAPGSPRIPPAKEIFSERIPRYGRYDELTKLGCACVALALRDAGLADSAARRPIGLVSASRLECLATDVTFYRSTLDEGGALASPNLFSYTLPGIVLGECAVNFKLTGPTLSVGAAGGRGRAALECAARLLESGEAPAIVAGWIESLADLPESLPGGEALAAGAAFVVLEVGAEAGGRAVRPLDRTRGRIASIFDLFEPELPR